MKVVLHLPNQMRGGNQEVEGFNAMQHSAIDADRRTGPDAKFAAGRLKLSTRKSRTKTPNFVGVQRVVDARDARGFDAILNQIFLDTFRIGEPPVCALQN